MLFGELRRELDSGVRQRAYVFTGDEREVMRQYIRRIGDKRYDVANFAECKRNVEAKSLFKADDVYVVDNDTTLFEKNFEDVEKSIKTHHVIFLFDSIDKRKKFFKGARVVEFNRFSPSDLISYTKKFIDVDDDTALALNVACGGDVSRINNAVHKLKHSELDINLHSIATLIEFGHADNIFDFLDCVARRDAISSFELFASMRENEPALKLLSLFYSRFRDLYLVQSYIDDTVDEIVKKTGVTVYVVNILKNFVDTYTSDELADRMMLAQSLEVGLKTGRIEEWCAVEYLLTFCFSFD